MNLSLAPQSPATIGSDAPSRSGDLACQPRAPPELELVSVRLPFVRAGPLCAFSIFPLAIRLLGLALPPWASAGPRRADALPFPAADIRRPRWRWRGGRSSPPPGLQNSGPGRGPRGRSRPVTWPRRLVVRASRVCASLVPTPVGVQLGIAMNLATMRPEPDSPQGGRGGPVQSARFRSLAPVSDIARRGGWHREVRGHDASAWAVRVSRTNFFAAAHPPGFPGSPGHRSRRTWPRRMRREDRSRLTMVVSSRLLSPPVPSATRYSTSVNGLVRPRRSPPRRRRHIAMHFW